VLVIDPAEGGGIGTWDVRAVRHALTAVLRRRPEAYHARLLAQTGTAPDGSAPDHTQHPQGEIPTIHDLVRSREPGLAARLHYDAYERRSGLVHLFGRGTTPELFATAAAVELGDAHVGAYEVVELQPGTVRLVRDVNIAGASGPTVVRVEKGFAFDGDRRAPSLALSVTVENRSAKPLRFDLGLEWALTMVGGGGNPDAYYRFGSESVPHDSAGARSAVSHIVSGNRYIGLELTTSVEPAATTWWSPIETISNSEFGFERVYQGSALVAVWPIDLAPGERRSVTMRHAMATTSDRAADELDRRA
jgi:alpha-amylase